MSQHIFVRGGKKFMFGWDQPLQSYFLQVHDMSLPEDERIVVWVGADEETKMYEVEHLVQTAMEYGFLIDQDMQSQLWEEKAVGV